MSYHLFTQARPIHAREAIAYTRQADNVRNLIGDVYGLGCFAIQSNIVSEQDVIQADEGLDKEKTCFCCGFIFQMTELLSGRTPIQS